MHDLIGFFKISGICVVGIRVYSKDEDLELRVVMEGGTLEEDGMGEKGEADLDNAQANAGGQRERKDKGEENRREDGGYEGDSEVERKAKKAKDKQAEKKEDEGTETEKEKLDDNRASYPTIVRKGEGQFEKPVEPKTDTETESEDKKDA